MFCRWYEAESIADATGEIQANISVSWNISVLNVAYEAEEAEKRRAQPQEIKLNERDTELVIEYMDKCRVCASCMFEVLFVPLVSFQLHIFIISPDLGASLLSLHSSSHPFFCRNWLKFAKRRVTNTKNCNRRSMQWCAQIPKSSNICPPSLATLKRGASLLCNTRSQIRKTTTTTRKIITITIRKAVATISTVFPQSPPVRPRNRQFGNCNCVWLW